VAKINHEKMRTEINQVFERMERDRVSMMSELSKYSQAALTKNPAPSTWSALQNVVHLMEAERGTLSYMKKKLHFEPNPKQTGWKNQWAYYKLRIAFGLPGVKIKAPSYLEAMPTTSDLQTDGAQWAIERQDFKQFVDNMSDAVLSAEVCKHPIVGKLNVLQMLKFMDTHCKRHYAQIRRAL
jgi:DinB superfamily